MKPVDFPGSNIIYAKNQPEYLPLPASLYKGIATTCWKMTWRERLKAFFTGKVYVQVMTYTGSIQPQRLTLEIPDEVRIN